MQKRWISIIATALLALTSAACNTARGAGEDIESVGDAVDQRL